MAKFILLSDAEALLFCHLVNTIDRIGQVTSMILLRWENLSSKCAKLHIVAAIKNRDHLTRSLFSCLFAPHIYRFYPSCTYRSWWYAHSMQR